jgi:hypothetical protein
MSLKLSAGMESDAMSRSGEHEARLLARVLSDQSNAGAHKSVENKLFQWPAAFGRGTDPRPQCCCHQYPPKIDHGIWSGPEKAGGEPRTANRGLVASVEDAGMPGAGGRGLELPRWLNSVPEEPRDRAVRVVVFTGLTRLTCLGGRVKSLTGSKCFP